ncbi:MAG: hypothetical protein ACRDRV_19675 [Pseudonocardiaceae bacterium]
MGRHEDVRQQRQVLYLGSSAALGALRRSMEAHGTVTRTRLTPAVDAVIADPEVSPDHPTVRAADSLGIPVLQPAAAAEQLAEWKGRPDPAPSVPERGRSSWSFRPGSR